MFETLDGTHDIASGDDFIIPRNDALDGEKVNGGTGILACVLKRCHP